MDTTVPGVYKDRKTNQIFIKGLPEKTSEADLIEYFSTFGVVHWVAIHRNEKTNKPRSLGLVEFTNADDVDSILSSPTVHVLHGRKINVSRAWKNAHSKYAELYVCRLIPLHNMDNLTSYFLQFGTVHSVKICKSTERCASRFAFVRFHEQSSLDKAMETEQHVIEGSTVLVNLSGKMIHEVVQQAQSLDVVSKDLQVDRHSLPARLEPQRPKKKSKPCPNTADF